MTCCSSNTSIISVEGRLLHRFEHCRAFPHVYSSFTGLKPVSSFRRADMRSAIPAEARLLGPRGSPSTRTTMQEALYTTRMPMGSNNGLLRAKPRSPCITEKGNARNARLGGCGPEQQVSSGRQARKAWLENAESDRKRGERRTKIRTPIFLSWREQNEAPCALSLEPNPAKRGFR